MRKYDNTKDRPKLVVGIARLMSQAMAKARIAPPKKDVVMPLWCNKENSGSPFPKKISPSGIQDARRQRGMKYLDLGK